VPRAFVRDTRVTEVRADELTIERGKKYFLNAGSVGQPRDQDWRASYILYTLDTHKIVWRRLPYDIEKAQAKIRESGLPARLADRLAEGR
jgi:diadenosine tetraphosphatase ApaH/serine/threonine PP2A family protein phosphatase